LLVAPVEIAAVASPIAKAMGFHVIAVVIADDKATCA
jgi:hypothetical protein